MALTTIIAGCDLSQHSDQALERAIGIALLHRAKIVLVHAQASEAPVAEVDSAALAQLGAVSAAIRAEEAVRLTDKLAEVQGLGLRAAVISRIGPPDEVLATAAHDEQADLIVVGTHGHSGVARFLLGSVANTTIRRAPCDVLVVRGSAVRAPFARPLVATDFSPAAAKALGHADNVVAPGSRLDIVHAWQLPAGSWGATLLGQARFPWSTVRDAVLASAEAQAHQFVADHGPGHGSGTVPGLHVDLVQGPPAQVITETAERGGHDLIVVGAHGNRGFRRLLLGSVAESTVRHAHCSVLVVHGPPRPPSHSG
ncbi:MAG TPA: universal stress protein [Kofleriaceae bacterium]|jgi:nucleotide-binding universal stress UspA family protein|nr:universal stress protein [Kofleriaceae bacterium]